MRNRILWIFLAACSGAPEAPAPDISQPAPPAPFQNPALKTPRDARYAASHILISWDGAVDSISTGRSERDAEALAKSIRSRIEAGEPFEALAQMYSNDPSGARGGALGLFATGTMVPIFEAAVASIGPGQLGPIIKTPFGFHIVRRDAIVEARISHILISHQDAPLSANNRPKTAAKDRAWAAYRLAKAGHPFQQVAHEYSDDSTVQVNGGDLGVIGPGQMVPSFDDAVFSIAPGHITEPFETPYGYHIALRKR